MNIHALNTKILKNVPTLSSEEKLGWRFEITPLKFGQKKTHPLGHRFDTVCTSTQSNGFSLYSQSVLLRNTSVLYILKRVLRGWNYGK